MLREVHGIGEKNRDYFKIEGGCGIGAEVGGVDHGHFHSLNSTDGRGREKG